ncbi:endo-1,4-beta-xylanase [Rubritalea marina]|uniref:endo-1,4-beta-xylanase n=1 Tax=Rubritalea marina TaxID=361055 RepID=UPI00146163B9|nr:endo-1,4-beta-xylanase [Rubritalea marina]
MKQAFKGDFLIGAAISKPLFEEETFATLNMVAGQFSSVSSCNMLKWGSFNPEPGVYNHETADAYVKFGTENKMYVVGHVLFWHNQTPKWVFLDEKGETVDRAELLRRMRERVRHVSKRYGTRIQAWDVVNESFMGSGKLRDSQWTRIIGSDFIEQAFRIAEEELPEGVELIYNDYSMTGKGKRDAVVRMVRELKEKGVLIDGVGLQGHWSKKGPSISEIEASIIAFSEAGVGVHITELDIDMLPRKEGMWGADVAKRLVGDARMDPYRDGLPEARQQELAKRYADLFQLFLKHKDKIKRVTFWGTTDKYSWLNNWPIKGRISYPLLFDRAGKAKPAFHAVLGLKDKQATPDE